jgi:aryl-phospho-beta-D-glucosidase BglC (GH1 family)
MHDKGIANGRAKAVRFLNRLIKNADTLGLELVIDYHENRSWRCDRATWIKGKWSGGDWFHIEISNAMANDENAVKQAFLTVFKDMPKTV